MLIPLCFVGEPCDRTRCRQHPWWSTLAWNVANVAAFEQAQRNSESYALLLSTLRRAFAHD
jgi:hypothetical protein